MRQQSVSSAVLLARFRPRASRGDSGASAVEFALIAPIFIVLIFGMIEFAFVFNQQSQLDSLTANASRRAAAVDHTQIFNTVTTSTLAGSGALRVGDLLYIYLPSTTGSAASTTDPCPYGRCVAYSFTGTAWVPIASPPQGPKPGDSGTTGPYSSPTISSWTKSVTTTPAPGDQSQVTKINVTSSNCSYSTAVPYNQTSASPGPVFPITDFQWTRTGSSNGSSIGTCTVYGPASEALRLSLTRSNCSQLDTNPATTTSGGFPITSVQWNSTSTSSSTTAACILNLADKVQDNPITNVTQGKSYLYSASCTRTRETTTDLYVGLTKTGTTTTTTTFTGTCYKETSSGSVDFVDFNPVRSSSRTTNDIAIGSPVSTTDFDTSPCAIGIQLKANHNWLSGILGFRPLTLTARSVAQSQVC